MEKWAVAALAVIDRHGRPLCLRTYLTNRQEASYEPAAVPSHTKDDDTASSSAEDEEALKVLEGSSYHLYVGSEDIVKMHFLLFSSLDRCDALWAEVQAQAQRQESQSARTAAGSRPRGRSTSAPGESASSSAVPSRGRRVTSTSDPRFLGRLLSGYRFTSYGFRSVTGITTLLITVGEEPPADAMVPLCRAVYECSSAALCNPFLTPARCVDAQLRLLRRAQAEATASSMDGATRKSDVERANPLITLGAMLPDVMKNGVEQSWSLGLLQPTPSTVQWSSSPSLAFSRTFQTQVETILGSFTVTARSFRVRQEQAMYRPLFA